MYKRRVIVFLAIIVLTFLCLLGRLFGLQILHEEDYRKEFDKQRQGERMALPAMRGAILDNHGVYLAKNIPCFEFCMDYRLMVGQDEWVARQKRAIARGLAKGRKPSAQDLAAAGRIYQEMSDRSWQLAAAACGSPEQRDNTVAEIVGRVGELVASRRQTPIEAESFHALVTEIEDVPAGVLRARLEGTIGVTVRPAMKRMYPMGEVACHIIGVTGPVGVEDRRRLNPVTDDKLAHLMRDYRLDDVIGLFGAERLCEGALRGVRGYRQASAAADGEPVVVEAQHGRDVRLTLDIDLQAELTRKFREMFPGRNGSAVLLNVQDGSILAMVSIPVYDLNTYRQEYARLAADDFDYPLMHRAVARTYEPGSTVKPMVALAGLDAGAITPETVSVCTGRLYPNQEHPGCTGVHGAVKLVEAISESCNIYFYRVGDRLERQRPGRLLEVYGEFGFGQALGTGLAGERPGRLPANPKLEDAKFWAIGQGLVVTPLHVADEMATIARRGEFISPTVVRDDGPEQVRRKLDIPDSFYDVVQQGMHEVTTHGTARRVFGEANLGIEVCGKSGTAQTEPQWQDKNGNHRMEPDEVLRDGDMVWFSGFAPYRNPQVAFTVVVEYVNYAQEGGGAKVAAPFAVEALRSCQARGYIK